MTRYRPYCVLWIIMIVWIAFPQTVRSDNQFIAYSIKEAERRLRANNQDVNAELKELGYITRIVGMVYDAKAKDLIVIGKVSKGQNKITLDDFAVALRALLVHKDWPKVSIDRTSDTEKTKKQKVNFTGGIENTQFGKDLLDADIVLKKLTLGTMPSDIWGVKSYFTLSAEALKQGKNQDNVSARFWFFPPGRPKLAVREGVFAIKELKIGVETQVMSINGQPVSALSSDTSSLRDELGDIFSQELTENFDDLSVYYPELGRLKVLFDLVALAKGTQSLNSELDMGFWLHEYKIQHVETDDDSPLLLRAEEIQGTDKNKMLEIDGGIELKALMLRLKDGDVTAMRDFVLMSRTNEKALTWRIPINGWSLPGATETDIDNELQDDQNYFVELEKKIGTTITRSIMTGMSDGTQKSSYQPMQKMPPMYPSPASVVPKFDTVERLSSYRRPGGVMLQGAATIKGSEEAKVDLTNGSFSFIVEGESAELDPAVFKNFVTALWSVYYSKVSPGISIDPIAPDVDKHLVRYIGNVINNDLGRVMRDADYTMKKWAVGTEKPDIPGFKDVDEIMGATGVNCFGASRRFWFVPEDMKFKRSKDMLLFDEGRMTLKTEYIFQDKKAKAEPADEKFAEFFTTKYPEISEKYPVYNELFEYAKLVSLAQYLKKSGIPLFWFLMANKDLLITEDSPGTVNELVKGSKYFQGIEIKGGVDLDVDKGQYVYDQQAVTAIHEAVSKLPTRSNSNTSMTSQEQSIESTTQPFTFEIEKKSYTVVPQHSLTSGKDRRGTSISFS